MQKKDQHEGVNASGACIIVAYPICLQKKPGQGKQADLRTGSLVGEGKREKGRAGKVLERA